MACYKNYNNIMWYHEGSKEVDKFVYLDSIVGKDGSTDANFKKPGMLSTSCMNSLTPEQNRILSNGSGIIKASSHKLQKFANRRPPPLNILNIRWPEVVPNEQLWKRTKQARIGMEVKTRKWGLIDLALRKPASSVTKQALESKPQGKWTDLVQECRRGGECRRNYMDRTKY